MATTTTTTMTTYRLVARTRGYETEMHFTTLSNGRVRVMRWTGYQELIDVMPITTAREWYKRALADGYTLVK